MEDQKLSVIQIVLGTASVLLLFACFIVLVLFHHEKKHFLFCKEITDLKLNYENNLLKSELEVQEQTFQQISGEIHDHIVPELILAKLNLNILNHADPRSNEEKITNSEGLISRVIQKLRDISISLNSDFIKENGLFHAVENEISILRNTGLYDISFTVTGVRFAIDSEKAAIIFRIIQEGLTNIVKHSAASTIRIDIQFEKDQLTIKIQDNGTGFNIHAYEQTKALKGRGLKNIRQRVRMLEGHCHIVSEIGNGTQLNITIPFPNSKHA